MKAGSRFSSSGFNASNLADQLLNNPGWTGDRFMIGRAALADIAAGRREGLILTNKSKELTGIASYKIEPNRLYIEYVATNGVIPGSGVRMMRQLSRIAAKNKVGIELYPSQRAEGFYRRLGMTEKRGTGGNYWFTAEQAAAFAKG